MKTIISNVRLGEESDKTTSSVYIENQKITAIAPFEPLIEEAQTTYNIINGHGHLLIPGMIDVHIHGANNYDMMDGTTKSIQEVSKKCAETGCTSFLVTSVSSSLEDLLAMIRSVKKSYRA